LKSGESEFNGLFDNKPFGVFLTRGGGKRSRVLIITEESGPYIIFPGSEEVLYIDLGFVLVSIGRSELDFLFLVVGEH